MASYTIEQSSLAHFFWSSKKSAPLWLLVRIYLGYEWLVAGWEKIQSPAWVGDSSGAALTGFVQGALHKTAEFCKPAPAACHADVQSWYGAFLQNTVLPNAALWSHMVAWGEILVGVALVLGFLVGISTFFGAFMNLNFLLAGTVSINPIMFTLSIFVITAWRVSGYWGLDRYVLPLLHKRIHPRNL